MDVPGYALVTGAASGIGRACAKAFAQEGSAGIALLDISLDNLAAVKAEIEEALRSGQHHVNGDKYHPNGASNGATNGTTTESTNGDIQHCRIETYRVDVSNETQVTSVVNSVAADFGRIDYVVNAAGIAMKHAGGVAFAETSDWQRIMDVNLNGSFYVLRAAAQIMLKQKPILSSRNGRPLQKGSIVNFSSIQGVVGITLSGAYTTAKHAIIGLTRTASEDYANQGVRINAICPGYTETPLTTKNPQVLEAMMERVGTAVPMQRMGSPDEIADGVLYLAGGRSSFVTGSALMVDGGYTSR